MSQVCLAAYNVCAIRITRLFSDGEPDFGADAYSVHVPISIAETVNTYETPAIQQPNGCGTLCVDVPADSSVTGYGIAVSLCENDYELFAMLGGGSTLVNGSSEIIGYADPPAGTDPGPVCVEAWQKTRAGDNIGTLNGVEQYIHHVWPYATFVKGDRTFENAATVQLWNGTTSSNDQIGATGPYNDWPSAINGPKGEFLDANLPTEFCGLDSLAS